ncbi:MFS transporter [Zavarzinia sp.]|uniref:MFS transporter n=1 Tax=Zavarzinia sp. TaxID=2027920 RepID=UPI00356B0BFD
MSPSALPKPASRRGPAPLLVIGAAAAILSVSMGIRQSLGLFLPPIAAEGGATAGEFGFALAVQSLVWGLAQPVVGALGDRFGARPVVIGCALVYALGLGFLAYGPPLAGLGAGAGLMVGIGIAGTGFGVLFGAVARIVSPARRVPVLGVVSAAGSLATLLIAPLGQYLIAGPGWRTAAAVFALVALAMVVLGVLLGGRGAAEAAPVRAVPVQGIGAAVAEALRHPGFLAMTAAYFACGFQLMYITVHLPAFLAFCGIAPVVGADALGLIGLGNAVGSLVAGWLGARFSQKRLLALAYLLRTLAIAGFVATPVTPQSALVFAAAMGLLWLGVVPLVSGLIVRMFGLGHFNTLFGVAFLSHQLGAFAGSWAGGLSVGLTGSYGAAWGAMLAIGAAAFLLQWTMDDRPRPAHQEAGGALPAPL